MVTRLEELGTENAAMKAAIRQLIDAFDNPDSTEQDLMRELSRVEWFVQPIEVQAVVIAERGKVTARRVIAESATNRKHPLTPPDDARATQTGR